MTIMLKSRGRAPPSRFEEPSREEHQKCPTLIRRCRRSNGPLLPPRRCRNLASGAVTTMRVPEPIQNRFYHDSLLAFVTPSPIHAYAPAGIEALEGMGHGSEQAHQMIGAGAISGRP